MSEPRLRDETGSSDPEVARAAALLRAVRRPEPCAARKQRVWTALAARPAARRRVLRPALAALILLLAGAAAATVTWIATTRSSAPAPRPEVPEVLERLRPPPLPQGLLPPPSDIRLPEQPPAPPELSRVALGRWPTLAPSRRAPAPKPLPPLPAVPGLPDALEPNTSVQSPAPGLGTELELPPIPATPVRRPEVRLRGRDEASLLLFAARALRHDRDARSAMLLLDYYFERFPRGALAEEALGLAIESAVAARDRRAGRLARRYLRLYPKGRFRGTAREALRRIERERR